LEAWGKLVGIIEQYVKKGDLIYIEGKLKTRSWEDESGAKKYKTSVNVMNLTMLGSKNTNEEYEIHN
jgi:single-strand DNA-binding protein